MEAPNSHTSQKSVTSDVGDLAAKATVADDNASGSYTGPFCDKCQVVQFNDYDQGGQIVSDSSGEKHVSFGEKEEISLVYEHDDTLPSLPVLTVSAQKGCGLCKLFKDFILMFVRSSGPGEELIEGGVRVKDLRFKLGQPTGHWRFLRNGSSLLELHFSLEVSMKWSSQKSASEARSAYFLVDAEPGPCATWLNIGRRPIPPYALSKLGVERLKELVNTHVKPTRRMYQGIFLPTRLLYVGRDGRSPRLMETHNSEFDEFRDNSKSRYVALSYRWGNPSEVLQTTEKSLPKHQTEIPMGILPGTYRDVVFVARALDIQFVWIDALCIIQGEKEDWDRESLQMKDIFDCAYITVCAVQGDCSDSGFLQRQRPPSVKIPFRSSLSPALSGSFFLRATRFFHLPPDLRFHAKEFYQDDVRKSTWYKRGWTFQESWAQSVQVLFGSTMVYCISKDIIEAENGSLDKDSRDMSLSYMFPQPHITRHASDPTNQERNLYHWSWVLVGYTGRDFTYESDRLPAISGIAKTLFCNAKEDDYLAGLWRMDLHRGLLWSQSSAAPPKLQRCLETRWPPRQYLAPSWSWASQPSQVYWPWNWDRADSAPEIAPSCTFLEAETTLEGRNPFGRVKSGHLKIHVKMCSIGSPRGLGSLPVGNDLRDRVGTIDREFVAYLELDFNTGRGGLYDHIPIWPEGRLRGFEMLLTTEFDSGKVAGLVLLPVDDENAEGWEYWRVGVWFSETEGGAFVAGMEEKTIRVI